MTIFKTLQDTINYINKVHGSFLLNPRGVNCYCTLRESNGTKTICSVTKGTKIISQTISKDDAIILEHEVRGLTPRKTTPQILTHSIYLSNLRMINIYDFFTEYLSTSRLDFAYFTQSSPSFALLDELVIFNNPKPIAQWIHSDEKLDEQLEHLGKTIVIERPEVPLSLDFD